MNSKAFVFINGILFWFTGRVDRMTSGNSTVNSYQSTAFKIIPMIVKKSKFIYFQLPIGSAFILISSL